MSSYTLHTDESLTNGIQRILLEQLDDALEQLRHPPEDDMDEAIHEARKCCKKTRAVFRLIRDSIGSDVYKAKNTTFRDAGRKLSDVRDSVVMIETLEDLKDHFDDQLTPKAFQAAHASLSRKHETALQLAVYQERAIQDVIVTLQEARLQIKEWEMAFHDFSDLYKGVKRVYKRGRKAFPSAYADPSPEHFHEWRKRVKYLWYHIRLLKRAWPEILTPLSDELHTLADFLGDDHDLSEFQCLILEEPMICEDEASREMLLGLVKQRQRELRTAARPYGERIYVEKPSQFADRMGAYWKMWKS